MGMADLLPQNVYCFRLCSRYIRIKLNAIYDGVATEMSKISD